MTEYVLCGSEAIAIFEQEQDLEKSTEQIAELVAGNKAEIYSFNPEVDTLSEFLEEIGGWANNVIVIPEREAARIDAKIVDGSERQVKIVLKSPDDYHFTKGRKFTQVDTAFLNLAREIKKDDVGKYIEYAEYVSPTAIRIVKRRVG